METKVVSAEAAVSRISDNAVVSVSSSSGLGCPDKVLEALGARFEVTGHPRRLTTLHPIAAGDMYGIKGIDHIARDGLLDRVIAGSYPSGASSLPMPEIWKMIVENRIAAYNVPSGILFDMHRDVAARRPGVLTQVGLDTFVDPALQGCAMNEKAADAPIVRRVAFAGDSWLHFDNIAPDVTILRATTADEHGNLTYEHEGAYLGGLDQAIAARNNRGLVIAQVKRLTAAGSLRPHDVRVPGHLVDCIVVDPGQYQTTETLYDPAISGEVIHPLADFELAEYGVEKSSRGVRRWSCLPGRPPISASASVRWCRGSCWKKARPARSPGQSSRGLSAACRSPALPLAAPPMPMPSCPRRTSSPISRAAASTSPSCLFWKSTARAMSMSPNSARSPI
nr:CoA-transferase [Marinicella sp. W31]MDC2879318.1 hypothetical protein [Marinicella sp. W31]